MASREISVPGFGEDVEILMYDVVRARREGLVEDLALHAVFGEYDDPMKAQLIEVEVTPELFEILVDTLDLGVNTFPDDMTRLTLTLKYRYRYGKEVS